jgi:hypothetical protein
MHATKKLSSAHDDDKGNQTKEKRVPNQKAVRWGGEGVSCDLEGDAGFLWVLDEECMK